VAPIMMPAEFIEEALVVPIFQAAVPQRKGYCWRTYFHPPRPTFLLCISVVVCLQRSHRRGSIFDSAEFANSIRRVDETTYQYVHLDRTTLRSDMEQGAL
jgi:hypothetical protein